MRQLRVTLTDESNYTNDEVKPDLLSRYYTSYHNILIIENGIFWYINKYNYLLMLFINISFSIFFLYKSNGETV